MLGSLAEPGVPSALLRPHGDATSGKPPALPRLGTPTSPGPAGTQLRAARAPPLPAPPGDVWVPGRQPPPRCAPGPPPPLGPPLPGPPLLLGPSPSAPSGHGASAAPEVLSPSPPPVLGRTPGGPPSAPAGHGARAAGSRPPAGTRARSLLPGPGGPAAPQRVQAQLVPAAPPPGGRPWTRRIAARLHGASAPGACARSCGPGAAWWQGAATRPSTGPTGAAPPLFPGGRPVSAPRAQGGGRGRA